VDGKESAVDVRADAELEMVEVVLDMARRREEDEAIMVAVVQIPRRDAASTIYRVEALLSHLSKPFFLVTLAKPGR
jgi:hypothetical protein